MTLGALLQLGQSCNGEQKDCSSTGNFQNAIAVSAAPQRHLNRHVAIIGHGAVYFVALLARVCADLCKRNRWLMPGPTRRRTYTAMKSTKLMG